MGTIQGASFLYSSHNQVHIQDEKHLPFITCLKLYSTHYLTRTSFILYTEDEKDAVSGF